ncbi:MAG: diacylglycerol kinase family lipid kinase [Nitrospirae bacterium]|nr:diacylglycerol kinase family lipid kinase [Nitrospirota bacterium]
MKSSALLIANPIAGKHAQDKIHTFQGLLLEHGIETELFLTGKRGDAKYRAKAGVSEQRPMIIAAGGDGTINEVINGMVHSTVPLGIIPLGTTNVLAIELDIETIKKALDNIINGSPNDVSLGRIKLENQDEIFFILMAGIGFDGRAVYGMDEGLKGISGKGAYILSGLKCFFKPQIKLDFIVDGTRYLGYSGIVSNASSYGGRFKIAPDANIKVPHLYVNIFEKQGRINLLRYLYGIISGSHTRYIDVRYLICKEIRIEGNEHIQIDGDYLGKGNCVIDIIPNALRLICGI